MDQEFVRVGRRKEYSKKPKHPRKEHAAAAPVEAPVKPKEQNKDGIDENTEICNHCFQIGHRSDKCPAKAAEKSEEMCVFCGKPGHKLADCPTGDPVREMECFFCGEKNHTYYQCPKRKEFLTKSEDGEREFESYVVCRNCGRVGHFESKCDQPSQRKTVCFHCGQTGHTSKECPNPKESAEALRVCRHCGELGHFATECPEPSVARPAKCPLCGGFGHKLEDCPRDMPAEKPKEEAKPKAAPKPAPKPKAKPLTPSDLNSTEQFPSL